MTSNIEIALKIKNAVTELYGVPDHPARIFLEDESPPRAEIGANGTWTLVVSDDPEVFTPPRMAYACKQAVINCFGDGFLGKATLGMVLERSSTIELKLRDRISIAILLALRVALIRLADQGRSKIPYRNVVVEVSDDAYAVIRYILYEATLCISKGALKTNADELIDLIYNAIDGGAE